MAKLIEVYEELQGRPASKIASDMDKRGPSIPLHYITTTMLLGGDDYMKAEDLVTVVNVLTQNNEIMMELIHKLLTELRQIKLHLAGISDENIDPRDGED